MCKLVFDLSDIYADFDVTCALGACLLFVHMCSLNCSCRWCERRSLNCYDCDDRISSEGSARTGFLDASNIDSCFWHGSHNTLNHSMNSIITSFVYETSRCIYVYLYMNLMRCSTKCDEIFKKSHYILLKHLYILLENLISFSWRTHYNLWKI